MVRVDKSTSDGEDPMYSNWALIIDGRDNILWWDGDPDHYAVPEGAITVLVPPDLAGILSIGWLYDGDVFTDPNAPSPEEALAIAKTQKTQELSLACQSHIYAGFVSSALGSEHTYPANDHSQVNLISAVVSSLYPDVGSGWATPFLCGDLSGVWDRRPHSAEQIQQVGADGKAAINLALDKNLLLANAVIAATSIAEVQAVEWVFP